MLLGSVTFMSCLSVRFFAAVHCLSVILPSSCMRSSTTLRRASARSGKLTGSVVPGFWVRPASSAACERLSLPPAR